MQVINNGGEDEPHHFRSRRSRLSVARPAAGYGGLLPRGALVRGARHGQGRVLGLSISVVRTVPPNRAGWQSRLVQSEPLLHSKRSARKSALQKASRPFTVGVRFGSSKADICTASRAVRFTPESGHICSAL